jgi:hydroxymethylbilane synthase
LAYRADQIFETKVLLPAVGQGALGLEMRENDPEIGFVRSIDKGEIRACVEAERSLLRYLRGGCQIPVGTDSKCEDGKITLRAAVANLEGTAYVEGSESGRVEDASKIGGLLARRILDEGGEKILSEIRGKG